MTNTLYLINLPFQLLKQVSLFIMTPRQSPTDFSKTLKRLFMLVLRLWNYCNFLSKDIDQLFSIGKSGAKCCRPCFKRNKNIWAYATNVGITSFVSCLLQDYCKYFIIRFWRYLMVWQHGSSYFQSTILSSLSFTTSTTLFGKNNSSVLALLPNCKKVAGSVSDRGVFSVCSLSSTHAYMGFLHDLPTDNKHAG